MILAGKAANLYPVSITSARIQMLTNGKINEILNGMIRITPSPQFTFKSSYLRKVTNDNYLFES